EDRGPDAERMKGGERLAGDRRRHVQHVADNEGRTEPQEGAAEKADDESGGDRAGDEARRLGRPALAARRKNPGQRAPAPEVEEGEIGENDPEDAEDAEAVVAEAVEKPRYRDDGEEDRRGDADHGDHRVA